MNATGKANANRTREYYIGGIAYLNSLEAHIENSSADTNLKLDGTTSFATVGGFVESNAGNIKNCYAKVNILNVDSSSRFGGFVCQNNGGIVNCYSEGEMNIGAAKDGKGGFAGYNNGNINSCFESVNIIATDATKFGAFVGSIGTASYITNCYYDMKSIYTTNGEHQVFENYYATQADPVTQLMDEFFVTETLGWSAEIWEFDPNKFEYPSIK